MEEPSVLDYVKSLLTPWKRNKIEIPASITGEAELAEEQLQELQPVAPEIKEVEPAAAVEPLVSPSFPWRALLALSLALSAQWSFSLPVRFPILGTTLLILSLLTIVWAYMRGEWLPGPPLEAETRTDPLIVRTAPLVIGLVLSVFTFLASGGNLFSVLNIALLISSTAFLMRAFWLDAPKQESWFHKLKANYPREQWSVLLSRWTLLVLIAAAVVIFFRFYRLNQVPPEMVSDHAEKYLDVLDILKGQPHIFFPRNGGREALQFYLVTGLHLIFNTGLNFLTLKISTAMIGILALPFIYLSGKEVGNRRIGLLAFIFAGISYWGNVVSRAGLRLPFYFLFTAATLYFLLRGIRTSNRNNFLLAGLSLGLGLYGYSANRILPLPVIAAVALYLLHKDSRGLRRQVLWQSILLALISLVVSLPLLRYIILDPGGFFGRMLSRLGSRGGAPFGQLVLVFLGNFWSAISMFSWSDGVVWVTSIPDYPALGVVTGALFYIGAVLLLVRYIRARHWLDIFLIVSIPLLMLPSILSLAFPTENPNLYRTGGAAIPVFLLVGIALDGLMTNIEKGFGAVWGSRFAWIAFAILFAWSALVNYDLVFNKYYEQYRTSSQNTSEIGEVIRSFAETVGSPESAWVMGYPHWADTRLVAINAGNPNINFALFTEELDTTLAVPSPKLFIVHPLDEAAINALPQYYEDGWFQVFDSAVQSKDFLIYFVPPEADEQIAE
ncbi:glycosyltransferase family 39 protein [Chloroflexota bacterium]